IALTLSSTRDLYKQAVSPIPPFIVHPLPSCYTGWTFPIFVDGELSTDRVSDAGILQGSVLRPVQYLIYSDTPLVSRVTSSLYVDDAMFLIWIF
ncbi:hypothetical protein J6590_062535, partial [Homalodisca vitripennis]